MMTANESSVAFVLSSRCQTASLESANDLTFKGANLINTGILMASGSELFLSLPVSPPPFVLKGTSQEATIHSGSGLIVVGDAEHGRPWHRKHSCLGELPGMRQQDNNPCQETCSQHSIAILSCGGFGKRHQFPSSFQG